MKKIKIIQKLKNILRLIMIKKIRLQDIIRWNNGRKREKEK